MNRPDCFVPENAAVLRTPALAVDLSRPDLGELVLRMRTVMLASSGVGLAAPQIGVAARVFVAEHGPLRLAVANPEISVPPGVPVWLSEGCLSLPGRVFLVPRAESVILSGFDLDAGASFTEHFAGFSARIIQHEMHHLDGVLIDTAGTPA